MLLFLSFQRKRVPLETLLPSCKNLSEPKHVTEKFDEDNAENFCDPITQPKVTQFEIDYENDPWYKYLYEQLTKLRMLGIEKRKEIDELRNPKPLPPLKKIDKEKICKLLI